VPTLARMDRIRSATVDDARAIAEIHVAGWQAFYRGLVPDDFLNSLSVDRREAAWLQQLAADAPATVWVTERDGVVIGFCATRPADDEDTRPGTAEIAAIYLRPDIVGTGVGRGLFAHAVDALRGQGFADAMLWVLASNARSRHFYEAAGWHFESEREDRWSERLTLRVARYRIKL
jgi:L-amino acid N-acyltransferase YncA